MKQLVITPDCPRCHGPLWWKPCPHAIDGDGCGGEHYDCDTCKVEWVYRPHEREWVIYDAHGRVVEIVPPRTPRFRRHPR